MDGFEWIFELKDAASGPAVDIVRSVKQVSAGFKDAGAASTKLDAGLDKLSDKELEVVAASKRLDKAQDALQKSLKETGNDSKSLTLEQVELVQAVRKAGSEFAKAEKNLKGFGDQAGKVKKETSSMFSGMFTAQIASDAIMNVASKVYEFEKAVVSAIATSVDFGRTTKASFSAMLGDSELGVQAYKNIVEAARATAKPLADVRTSYATLVATGMKAQDALDLTKIHFDWAAVGGEEAEAGWGKLTDLMTIGKVEAAAFEDIAKNVGGRMALGSALGLGADALAETAAGTELLDAKLAALKPDKFLQVVIALSKGKNELGAVSKSAATFGQRLDSIKEVGLQRFVQEADLSGEAADGLLTRLDAITQSQGFKDFARDMGDVAAKVGDVFLSIVDFVTSNWGTISMVLGGIAKFFGTIAAWAIFLNGLTVAVVASVVAAIGLLVGAITSAAGWIGGVVQQIPEAIGTWLGVAKDYLVNLANEMPAMGANIVQGLIDGISGMIGKAVAKASELASAVANAAKGAFGINSPSKLFSGFGGYITEGLAGGIDKTSDRAVIAAQNLANGVESGVVDALGIHSPSRVLERLGKFTAMGFEKGANDNATPWIPEIGDAVIPQMQGMDPLSLAGQSLPSPQAISPSSIQVQAPPSAPSSGSSSTFTVTFAPGAFAISGGPGGMDESKVKEVLTSAFEDISKRHGAGQPKGKAA